MQREAKVDATRTVWVANCPGCGDSVEHPEKRAKIRFCTPCQRWIPYVETSYPGPKLVRRSNPLPGNDDKQDVIGEFTMADKTKTTKSGTVEKLVKPMDPREPEKAQINIHDTEPLY